MKFIKNIIALAILVFGFSAVNSQAQVSFAGGKSISTSTVERKVKKEILKLPYYGVFDSIAYRIDGGGTVTLYGKVVRPTTGKDAARVVRKIEGVSNVVNNIEVLPLSNFDDSIRLRSYQTFARSGGLSRYLYELNPSVRIIVERGNLTLEGFVATRGDYNFFNVLANGVTGVFNVTNNLVVDSERVR